VRSTVQSRKRDVVSTTRAQPRCLLGRAGRGDHCRTGQFGELHAAHADAAGGAQDQHFLARRDVALGNHHASGGAVGAG
jgi:hypothetical protein